LIHQFLNANQVILASGSPRRKELLEMANIEFKVIKPGIDEAHPENVKTKDVPEFLANKKCLKLQLKYKEACIIAADTLVLSEGRILEKPEAAWQAKEMLNSLSTKTHEVITGVAFYLKGQVYSFSESTQVSFGKLTTNEITYYIQKYKPFDKAGSYGIQEWIGLVGIEKINGCYYNVMGLPIHRLFKELNKHA